MAKALKELIAILEEKEVRGDPDLDIKGIYYDSRRVTPGSLFACLRGQLQDGHDFAGEARKRGASALLVDHFLFDDMRAGVAEIKVPDTREALALVSSAFFDHPSKSLRMIGVTGTNGKTTTTHLIRWILVRDGRHAGLIGTVQNVVGGKVRTVEHTTPEAPDLQALLYEMAREGDDYAVMEVSSHGIHQKRVAGCEFDVLVFTNLTQDHLDYHGSMEDYFQVKASLFCNLGTTYWGTRKDPELKCAVINADDEWGRRVISMVGRDRSRVLTYGINSPEASIAAENVEILRDGSRFDVVVRSRATTGREAIREAIYVPLTGRYNVYNTLAAIAVAINEGIALDTIAAALATMPQVPGRLESVREGQDFSVFVDYAHTPDGLEKVIRAVRDITHGRVIVVFGCGGDRDRKKRPVMGRIATTLSDVTILTSDNPRSEDPASIAREVEAGLSGDVFESGRYSLVLDRREAIMKAIDMAMTGDSVLIAGKGHETYQIYNFGKVPFDDRMVVQEALSFRTTLLGKSSYGKEADWGEGLLEVGEVCAAVGGTLISGDPKGWISGVTIDSRAVRPGDLFIALVGEKTDGHLYVQDALTSGAGAALVCKDVNVPAGPVTIIRTDDTRRALLELAGYIRRKNPLLKAVGITGSVGKTTTKEMTASILSRRFLTLWNKENLNTEIGLPLTLLGLRPWHEVIVAEMGMRGPGEITELARSVRPSVGVITNIGPIHLERLGSITAIAKAKGELLESLPKDGVEILNRDDPNTVAAFGKARRPGVRRIWFGESEAASVRAENIRRSEDGSYVFDLRLKDVGGAAAAGVDDVRIPLPGRHNVSNALAACSVGLALGMDPEECKRGIATLSPIKMRLETHVEDDITFICDYYNSHI
ncbi:MAG TPA: UDP-N-acetylmuramoyl-L-alanyl-D-glutamate--2,6-diaminopimelate ligase [Clostridia bacterium]|nr:UDP-N-acetylmuramoyl-L-alanyl-D-glutamate--2,6-diaminopimelate ligase [Clostridia bacterium]